MEDVVAFEVKDQILGNVAFMTWGRLFDRVDANELEKHILTFAKLCGCQTVKSIRMCAMLQEVSHHSYFYEALIYFSRKPILSGPKYKTWVIKTKKEVRNGKQIFFLGKSKTARRAIRRKINN